MKDTFKAIILPLNDLFLNNFKGYTVNFNPISKKETAKIHRLEKYRKWYLQKKLHPFKIAFLLAILPFFIVSVIISVLIDLLSFKIASPDNFTFKKFFPFIEKLTPYQWPENYNSKLRRKYGTPKVVEDIPAIFEEAAKFHVKIILYGFEDLNDKQILLLDKRKKDGHITEYYKLQSFADLESVIIKENISIRNSHCLINDPQAIEHLYNLGFILHTTSEFTKNIQLIDNQDDFDDFFGFEIKTHTSYRFLPNLLQYYIFAKYNAFFNKSTILFIEDEYDKTLNDYITKNIESINERLAKKDFRLLHLPSIKHYGLYDHPFLINLIEQRIPGFYSLPLTQKSTIAYELLKHLNPSDFYSNLHEELGLPYYKRPCLLRPLPDGTPINENRFTYAAISYTSVNDLDKFFDDYIKQVKLPKKDELVFYQLSNSKSEAKKEIDHNAEDYLISHFDPASLPDLPIKKAIDELKELGEHKVMAEAIIYLFRKLKEEKPELLREIFPSITEFQEIKTAVILSPILIDRHYKILLPDFGHQEVKMHALPKALYLFYLLHPEGVAFKELYMFRSEVLKIYYRVTNRYDKQEIIKAIDDLVDMSNPSINQKSSRIREAFRLLMDEQTASYYYISGNPGEPKKILLNPDMIHFLPNPFE